MSKHRGSCHCGAISFEAKGEFTQAISCNCSICQKKGSLLAFVPETAFKLVSGEAALTDYQFGKKNIHHTFCKTCGVTPFSSGQAPDGTKVKAINLRCLDGIDLKSLQINEVDGRSF